MGDIFKRFSNQNGAAPQSGNKGSLKERMADKIGDMKAGAQIKASKDMLQVARDSAEPAGGALNAQKPEKGTYKYKTDALIKMLDGLVAKMNPQLARTGNQAVKNMSSSMLVAVRDNALKSGNFKEGAQDAVNKLMQGYRQDPLLKASPKGGASKADAAFAGQELKILHEVLSTLATRMSPDESDKFGLNKNKPSERDQSDRSAGQRTPMAQATMTKDARDIEDARNSRVYHARLGKAVKNMGGALKETARTTGAALRTYTEPARRDVAIGGLKTVKGTLDAAEQVKEGLDEAQAHVVGGTWGAVKGVGLAAAKAGTDLGKSAARTASNIAQGTVDVVAHGAKHAKKAHGAQVAKAKARKSSSKAEAPAARPAQAAKAQAPASRPESVRSVSSSAGSIRSVSSTGSSASSVRSERSSASTGSVSTGRSLAQSPQMGRSPSVRSVAPSIGGDSDASSVRSSSSRRSSVSSTGSDDSFRTAQETDDDSKR